jgi:hypothetical protein
MFLPESGSHPAVRCIYNSDYPLSYHSILLSYLDHTHTIQIALKGHVAFVADTDVSNLYRLLCEMDSAQLAHILMNPQQREDTFGGWIAENTTRISYAKTLISTTYIELQKPKCITFKGDEDELSMSLQDTFLAACESEFRRTEPSNHNRGFVFDSSVVVIKVQVAPLS